MSEGLSKQTDEGGPQELRSARREVVVGGGLWPDSDDTMIVNMGPQPPRRRTGRAAGDA